MDMTPEYALGLATGYAWGRTDDTQGQTAGTIDGITFGNVYRAHVEREINGQTTTRYSIQRAYEAWISGEDLP